MLTKTGVLFTVLTGCLALPTPSDGDISQPFPDVTAIKIVNGTVAPPGSHPHMVALTVGPYLRSLFCGGALVSKRAVLTAAHCIEPVYINGALCSTLRMTVGTNRWNSGGQTYTLSSNVTHQDFDRVTLKNDIGLLIASTDVVLSGLVKTISLTYDEIPGGVEANVAGWGRTGTYDRPSEELLEINIPTISGEECNERYIPIRADIILTRLPPIDPKIEICTFYGRGTGFCQGDSGSALTRKVDGRQIGIVSWGLLCARGAPDVFTRISGFSHWLHQHIID